MPGLLVAQLIVSDEDRMCALCSCRPRADLFPEDVEDWG